MRVTFSENSGMLAAMMNVKHFFGITLLALSGLFFSSCSRVMGYSLLLWNLPDNSLQDGDVVKVYIKSNISHVYVISTLKSDEKIEVPVWQITEPRHKFQLGSLKKRYAEYSHVYAHVALDGLPVRSEAANTAKQVYRLRLNETVRILYKGTGPEVMAGKNALQGDWLYVLTQDGTTGWCFSYNLKLYKTGSGGTVQEADNSSSAVQETDEVLDAVLVKKWYPENYAALISAGTIDLRQMNESYGFDPGSVSGTVSVVTESLSAAAPYAGTVKTGDGEYKFNGIELQMKIISDTGIVLTYTGESGKPQSYNFISVEEDVAALITAEKERRAEQLHQLYLYGPGFASSNYGSLSVTEDNSFSWSGYDLLVPSLISRDAKTGGTVSIEYLLSPQLASLYDGVLTFHFDGMGTEVNFLYKKENDGLRLEDASGASYAGGTVTARGRSAITLFFARSGQ